MRSRKRAESGSGAKGVALLGDGAPIFVGLDIEIESVGVDDDPEFVGKANHLVAFQFMRFDQFGIGGGLRQQGLHECQRLRGDVELDAHELGGFVIAPQMVGHGHGSISLVGSAAFICSPVT